MLNRDRWEATLDDLEHEIAQLEFGFASGNLKQIAAAGPWSPPDGLTDLPIEYKVRAETLMRRLQSLEQIARETREQLHQKRDDIIRQRQAATAYVWNDGRPTQTDNPSD